MRTGREDEAFDCGHAEVLLAVPERPLDHGSLGLVGAYVEITSTEVRAWMERARGLHPKPTRDGDPGTVPSSSEPEWTALWWVDCRHGPGRSEMGSHACGG